ncbi:hypothetical protein K438DRAFT_1766941 [Mycena galopus ATCC 62051]|nr:hypothetical protein K438DRAFT_1766941 [Mycena galopus ATCC 62051]
MDSSWDWDWDGHSAGVGINGSVPSRMRCGGLQEGEGGRGTVFVYAPLSPYAYGARWLSAEPQGCTLFARSGAAGRRRDERDTHVWMILSWRGEQSRARAVIVEAWGRTGSGKRQGAHDDDGAPQKGWCSLQGGGRKGGDGDGDGRGVERRGAVVEGGETEDQIPRVMQRLPAVGQWDCRTQWLLSCQTAVARLAAERQLTAREVVGCGQAVELSDVSGPRRRNASARFWEGVLLPDTCGCQEATACGVRVEGGGGAAAVGRTHVEVTRDETRCEYARELSWRVLELVVRLRVVGDVARALHGVWVSLAVLYNMDVRISLSRHFPEYAGSNDLQKTARYILWKFVQENGAKLMVYPQYLSVTFLVFLSLGWGWGFIGVWWGLGGKERAGEQQDEFMARSKEGVVLLLLLCMSGCRFSVDKGRSRAPRCIGIVLSDLVGQEVLCPVWCGQGFTLQPARELCAQKPPGSGPQTAFSSAEFRWTRSSYKLQIQKSRCGTGRGWVDVEETAADAVVAGLFGLETPSSEGVGPPAL